MFKRSVETFLAKMPYWDLLDRWGRRIEILRSRVNRRRKGDDGKQSLAERRDQLERMILSWGSEIRRGPFVGMSLLPDKALGSKFCPKILGVYEREIQFFFEQLKDENYELIVDIGSAEGYYTVGLAKKFPDSRVVAVEPSKQARELCWKNAQLNEVAFEQKSELLPDELVNLVRDRRCLVVCDCEGYEDQLMTHEVCQALVRSDCIVETHDFVELGISQRLFERAREMHQVEVVKSVDDVSKAMEYLVPELEGWSLQDRWLVLREGRPGTMRWICMWSREAGAGIEK